jgi:hypothetical protein
MFLIFFINYFCSFSSQLELNFFMTTTIKIKRSSSNATPTLSYGELGYANISGNSNLYIGNTSNQSVLVGSSNLAISDTLDFTSTTGTISKGGIVNVCNVSNAITRTLPSASENSGKKVTIINSSTSTANVNVVGGSYAVVLIPSRSISFQSDGNLWQFVTFPELDIISTASTSGTIASNIGMEVCTVISAITRTLPNAHLLLGRVITIVNSGNSSGVVNVSGGVMAISLNPTQAVSFQSDGTGWQVISIPIGGTTNQLAYFTSSSAIASNNKLTFNGNNLGVGGSFDSSYALKTTGNIYNNSSLMVLGQGESGTPTPSVIRGANASGSNVSGANLKIQGSNGTGLGGGGDIIFETAEPYVETPFVFILESYRIENSNTASFYVTIQEEQKNALILQIVIESNTSNATQITCNGINLTLLKSVAGTVDTIETWYLLSPPSENVTITIQLSSASNCYGTVLIAGNVNQVNPFGIVQFESGNQSTSTLNVASNAGALILDFVAIRNVTLNDVLSSQNSLWSENINAFSYAESSVKNASSGTTSVNYNWNVNQEYAIMAFSLNTLPYTEPNMMLEVARVSHLGNFEISGKLKLKSTPVVSSGYSNLVLTSDGIVSLVEQKKAKSGSEIFYSSDEILTENTFITGEAIYRKVVNFENITGMNNILSENLNFSYFKDIIKLTGVLKDFENQTFHTINGNQVSTRKDFISCYVNNDGLILSLGSLFKTSNSGYIIIEYTKA